MLGGRCAHVSGLLMNAARTPLAFMLSADQIPIKSTRSKALWDRWVCLVPGSTGLA